MKNEQRQSDAHELLLEPLVRSNQLGNRLGRLRLVRDERVVVHELYNLGIAREQFILEVKDVGVRGEVANAFENRESKIRCWNLVGKTFADQTSEFGWVFERIDARHDAARAVTEQEHGRAA